MTRHYVITTRLPGLIAARPTEKQKIALKDLGGAERHTSPSVGDQILIVADRNGVYESLSPHVFRILATDKNTLTVELEHSHNGSVPVDRVRGVLNRGLFEGINPLSPAEYDAVLGLLGNVRFTETQLLDHIRRYISARGYYFDDETIANYHICLKTRPFVILAGLSGTGKSKLSQLYAEAIGHTVENERYLRLAVRPSWNDDRYLLGYLDPISGSYVTEPAVEFVIQAERDRDNLYFFCLDEMNLAHVEHYFSQFLSALEEENSADRRIPLFSRATEERLKEQGHEVGSERTIIVPPNLLFTGTVNVDETTQPLSDKVIDRANTIEFFEVALDKTPERLPTPDPVPVSASSWFSYVAERSNTNYRSGIIEISKILNRAGLGLGYRVLREVESYLANADGLLKPDVAFDLQIKQRILPRVRGTVAIQPMLTDLLTYLRQHNLSRSAGRLEEMGNRLRRDGYTSYWR